MSHTKSHPHRPSPSLKGSRPVADVLNRIPVRDPYAESFAIFGRRLADYESHAPAFHFVALAVITAVIVGSLWLAFAQKFDSLWNGSTTRAIVGESLSIPEGLHIAP